MIRLKILLSVSLILGLSFAPCTWAEEEFSHNDWASVLTNFVDDSGLVDYQGLRQERATLDRYVETLGQISPESQPEQFPSQESALAYYLNAYNALVFTGVLDLPEGSRSVWGKTQSGYGFFVRKKFILGKRRLSLKKLEDEIIRKQFGDPRIHAALNCASTSCPRLLSEPFLSSSLNMQLEAAMRGFIRDPRHCRVNTKNQVLEVSKIFDWFAKDFAPQGSDNISSVSNSSSLIAYLNRYLPPEEAIPAHLRVRFIPYDKSLNSQP